MKIPFTNLEVKKTPEPEKVKNFVSVFGAFDAFGFHDLGFMKALNFYKRIAPVGTCVDIVTDDFAQLRPVLFDKNKEEFVKESPVLDLLNNPNTSQTGTEFLKALSTYFVITGNGFIIATGTEKNKPPKELFVVPSQDVNIRPNNDGLPGEYVVRTNKGSVTFSEEIVNGRSRYFSPTAELWQIKTFNPTFSTTNLFGLSRLSAIFQEIEQYELSSIHNLSILSKGARPSGILIKQGVLDDKEYDRLREQLQNQYAGATNAGQIMLMESGEGNLEYKQLSLSNKDMEFMQLKKDAVERICNRIGVPLPLVLQDASTFNNLKTSVVFLYTNAVLPMADLIFHELSLFLLQRYGLKNTEITYDPEDIDALQPQRNEELTKLKELDVLSINELRAMIGKESIGEAGDIVYIPSALIPAGSDQFTDDNLEAPGKPSSRATNPKGSKITRVTKKEFREIMKRHDFTDEEVEDAWELSKKKLKENENV